MNANKELVETIMRSPIFREYENAYTEAMGMPVGLRPLETWQIPLHGRRNENRFCALMAEKNKSCAACLQFQEKLAQSAMDRPSTMTCTYGLCETVVPVRLGGETIGFLQTGQVFPQKPTEAAFDRAMVKANELGVDLDLNEARAAFFETPIVDSKKMKSVTSLLTIFADHLAIKSNQIAIQQDNAEPPLVVKAKQFIQDHIAEEVTLAKAAAEVHTSVFYFCKQFRKYVGMTFTEYVSRMRVERAKSLLLNPNLRVSEIAFEIGFQSLTHFNRVFRSVAGESPTDYRQHLPKAVKRAGRQNAPRALMSRW